jgi:hypothetical protein
MPSMDSMTARTRAGFAARSGLTSKRPRIASLQPRLNTSVLLSIRSCGTRTDRSIAKRRLHSVQLHNYLTNAGGTIGGSTPRWLIESHINSNRISCSKHYYYLPNAMYFLTFFIIFSASTPVSSIKRCMLLRPNASGERTFPRCGTILAPCI